MVKGFKVNDPITKAIDVMQIVELHI